MTRFGDFIRKEREKLDLTQTQFGAQIGINSSAISRIENGSQTFSKGKLVELARIFNIDIQLIRDIFYADKFAKEAFMNRCSDQVFSIAIDVLKYVKIENSSQGTLNF